jgi:hypothetical protein
VYETTAHAASLDEAVRVGRRAVEQTNSGPGPLATAATNLGNVLLTRFELRSAPYDLDDSVAAARRAVELTPTDSPFRVARLSNLANVLREKAFRGVEGAAIELLTSVVWRGLNRVAQEQLLIGLRTLAASSAAAAVESGDPARAIELLEAGRSILWQQNIHPRDDLTKLAIVDEKLGQRIAELSNALMAGG